MQTRTRSRSCAWCWTRLKPSVRPASSAPTTSPSSPHLSSASPSGCSGSAIGGLTVSVPGRTAGSNASSGRSKREWCGGGQRRVFLWIRSPISTSSASGTTTPGLTWAWRAKHLSKHGIPWPVDNSAISRRGMDCSPVSGGQLEVCAVFPSSSADSTPYVYELARTAVNRPVFRANSSVAWVVSGLRCVRTRQIRRVRVHLEGCGRRGQDTGNESLSRRPWEGGGRSQRRTAERK